MSLMSTEQTAEFLGVKVERVKRLARESLLIAKSEDEDGEPQFDSAEVAKYKELAARFGGL
ncbi:helix-turn-helix domain-containing protein [Pseudoalteromonas sp. MMG006]|uniref:helix-turn-helix domain-containing protein n=1 Tax=unclassified Pseudoalteromonas TaxID=194690 RepID=UPI001B38FD0C|nr:MULTISPECIES: helix-turn-helix domain-containing protein [unclassified Pseudoalteromonas]MBQ4800231.1 helix-turn-helix domain-containing protein [Pseudoalteromonas sp. MMG006]MBQ4858808.1 helix-turn-helix domain-containing protein [Pseudoalteromonas sp. MMG007]